MQYDRAIEREWVQRDGGGGQRESVGHAGEPHNEYNMYYTQTIIFRMR